MKPNFNRSSFLSDGLVNSLHSQTNKLSISKNSQQPCHSNMEAQNQLQQFFSMFQSFLKNNEMEKRTTHQINRYDLEPRDREVIIPPPSISNETLSESQLKKWTTEVMKTICSVAFNYCSHNEMSFEQAKIYCSENMIKNIITLGRKVTLTKQHFEIIDTHLKTKVIKYLTFKYPINDEVKVNKKLDEKIREVDNIESLQHDYFSNTEIVFQHRDDGNYNDLIMKMLNQLMEMIDGQSGEQRTNYNDFQQFMSNLFEKVEDEDWVRDEGAEQIGKHSKDSILINRMQEGWEYKQKMRKRNEEKQAYRARVKQYTKYQIGRKIPENAPQYSETQIRSMSVDIKSPALLRILTKLCEELLSKFQTDNYYKDRSEDMKLQGDNSPYSIFPAMRKQLDRYLLEERENIQKQMKDLSDNNYAMQENVMKFEMSRKGQGDEHVHELQRISGKFSLKTVRNLHSYTISLLNHLIHRLMKVAKRFHQFNRNAESVYWHSPLNLLNFKVGDLMRCKCSSQEKQILRIYKELERLSMDEPQKLCIVRIKNRLSSVTNDILLNVKFNGKIMCEIQLAVKATTSKSSKYNHLFDHFFYELRRSCFGPLTELCSIWSSLDPKSQIYQQIVDQQDLRSEKNEHTCKQLNEYYKMMKQQRPFICGQCSRTYLHNNYIRSHSRCSLCDFFICAKCQLNQESEQQLISSLIGDPNIRNICIKRITDTEPLPQLGVCVSLESHISKVEVFTHFITQNGKQYILSKNNSKIQSIAIIGKKKEQKSFRSKYLIFKAMPTVDFCTISKDEIRKGYFLIKKIKDNYRKEKENLFLEDEQLTSAECRRIIDVGTQSQKERVRKLFLDGNVLTQLPFNLVDFSHIAWLRISNNPLDKCPGLEKCHNLSTFHAQNCSFDEVPTEILSLKNIVKLLLSKNTIANLPVEIANFQRLRLLTIGDNRLSQLPEELCECINLKTLNVARNRLKKLPQTIYKLENLDILFCQGNLLTTLPKRIGEMKCLKTFNVSNNITLKYLPISLGDLGNLEWFDCQQTRIASLHENMIKLKLKTLQLPCFQPFTYISSINSLQTISIINFDSLKKLQLPQSIGQLTNIKQLSLNKCNLTNIPESFKKLKHLQTLDLSQNRLSQINVGLFTNLTNLQIFVIRQNGLQKFPNLSKCLKLTKINLNDNQIQTIPNNFIQGLTNIIQLRINSNKIKYFPISVLDLSSLIILQAQSNPLQSIINEDNINQQQKLRLQRPIWPKLVFVNLYNTQLSVFPKILLQCNALQRFAISTNKITTIPAQIGNLINLKILMMNFNQISVIPKQLSHITGLQQILLASNKISNIPKELQQIIHLRTLNLDDNPIQNYQNLEWIINRKIECCNLREKIIRTLQNLINQYD